VAAPDRNGEAEGALRFDGNDQVVVGNDGGLSGLPALTVCLWVRPDALAAASRLLEVSRNQQGRVEGDAYGFLVLRDTAEPDFWVQVGDQLVHLRAPHLRVGVWSHLCGTFDGTAARAYSDGALVGVAAVEGTIQPAPADLRLGGCEGPGDFCASRGLAGALDEVVLLDRALSPMEVRHVFESRRGWGTQLLPGAQADYDDLRVLEGGREVEFEVAGARRHSDTPCPMAEDDGTWANRHDLCGVMGYWPLDGDGRAAAGHRDGDNQGGLATRGRFGDRNGALLFGGNEARASVVVPPADEVGEVGDFTIEAWFRLDDYAHNTWDITYLLDVRPPVPEGQPDGDPAGAALIVDREDDGTFELYGYYCAVEPTACHGVRARVPLVLGRWHHAAYIRWGRGMQLYFDGLSVPFRAEGDEDALARTILLAGQRTVIGGWRSGCDHHDQCLYLPGALDEVLVHSVAKSADYLYKRAHPLPRVRLLVRTGDVAGEGGRYAYEPYELRWGAPDAALSTQVTPDGLLSPRNGYAAWWRLGDRDGAPVVDSSTWRGHGAQPAGDATGEPVGRGAGLVFDGTTGLQLSQTAGLGTPTWTLEAAVRVDQVSGFHDYVLLDGADGEGGRYVEARRDGRWGCVVLKDTPGGLVAEGGATALEQWQHVACVLDETRLRLFVDGDMAWETPLEGFGYSPSGQPLYVGGQHRDPPATFTGALDEVRVMNRPLTPQELLHFPLTSWAAGEVAD